MRKMIRMFSLLVLAPALLLSGFACASGSPSETTVGDDTVPGSDERPERRQIYYVSADAPEDGADGTELHPFATLEAARDAVRTTARTEDLTGIDVIVSGTFFRKEPFSLTDPADSGSALCPVRWIGTDGAEITGGIAIDAASLLPVSPSDPLYTVFREDARDTIVSVDLKAFGVTGTDVTFGEWKPYAGNGNAFLFADGSQLHLAQYPDPGKDTYIAACEEKEDGTMRFRFTSRHAETVGTWRYDPDHIYLSGYFKYFWVFDQVRVLSFDLANNDMFVPQTAYGCIAGQPFCWYNIPEELTAEGEYYISENAVLYVILPENTKTLRYPLAPGGLLEVNGAHLTFEHLTFSDSRDTMTRLSGDDLTFQGCVILRSGEAAMEITGQRNRVMDCEISCCAAGGISIEGGDADTRTPSDCIVTNNYIHDFALSGETYCSAVKVYGCGVTVSHNEIAHACHQALSWKGHDHIFEYNEIYDVCNHTDDAGCCYSGRTLDRYGIVLRYNYFHDIGSPELLAADFDATCNGIYWDDGLGGQTAYGNIFENFCCGTAFAVGGGPDNVVENNLMLNCATAVSYDHRNYHEYRESEEEDFETMRELQAKYTASDILASAYPTILQMKVETDLDDPWFWGCPARSVVRGNVAYCTEGRKDEQFCIDEPALRFSTVENNTVNVISDDAAMSVEEALRGSGLDIPLSEIGRVRDGN